MIFQPSIKEDHLRGGGDLLVLGSARYVMESNGFSSPVSTVKSFLVSRQGSGKITLWSLTIFPSYRNFRH